VDAGGSATLTLRIRNTGDIVEEYHVDVVGDPALWCATEPSSVRVYPGTTATVRLTFSPPRSPDVEAGTHPFGVRVAPVENPDAVMVPEGSVTVTPFVDVRAELLPQTVRGWRRARPRLVVDNYGNTTATAAVSAESSGSRVHFDIRVPNLQVPPGRAHFSVVRLRPERLLWAGQKVSHPFSAKLQLSGSQPAPVTGTYVQPALLPHWMARLFAGLLALLALVAGLWLAIHPSVSSRTTAAPSILPSASVVIVSGPPPPPSASSPTSPSAPTASSPSLSAAPPAGPGKTAAPPAGGKPAPPSPLAYWKLNQGSGASAPDAVGHNQYPATFTNVTWCPNGGACASFSADSHAQTKGPVLDTSPGAGFTVAAWVWLASTTTPGIETMVSQDGTTASGFYLQFLGGADGDHWAFSRPAARAVANVTAQAHTWTYLAGTYDGATRKLTVYVNGKEAGTATDPAPQAGTGPLVMGRARGNSRDQDWFTGYLAQVQVYQSVLTPAQINQAKPPVP